MIYSRGILSADYSWGIELCPLYCLECELMLCQQDQHNVICFMQSFTEYSQGNNNKTSTFVA